MKHLLLTAITASLLGTSAATAGLALPYESDFYRDYTLDQGWQSINNVRRGGIPWSAAGVTDDLLEIGAKGAACKTYNSNQTLTADAWLISPAIDVTAGVEYTVSVKARTKAAYGETENFRITASTESTINALKTGTVILDKKNYSNTGDYEELTATYMPAADGEVYFGVQCYSEPDMDHLYLTRFSVTDSSGGGGDTPDTPPAGKTLPYEFHFNDAATFADDWVSVAGPGAASQEGWSLNSFSGFAEFDKAEGLQEDNYLISPALAVTKAATYAIDTKVWANGRLEVLLGTDPEDLSSFNPVATFEDTPFPDTTDKPTRTNVSITETGTYHVAFRACSPGGTYMGHRIYAFGFKENVPTPAIVTDLKATADPTDELSVNLSWTYPSLTSGGTPLDEIVKAELFRGDDLIKTFNYPTPGAPWAYQDTDIAEPGVYTYKIVIYGQYGANTDDQPIEVPSGYVGKPVIPFPANITLTSQPDIAAMFTVNDENNDGNTWVYETGSWTKNYVSANTDDNVEMDDYLCTPYLHLQAGYYLANFKTCGKNNTYELGYVTNRHLQASTFVKLAEISGDTSSVPGDHKIVVVITAEGDYAFSVHHTGRYTDSSYYNNVTMGGFELAEQPLLPGTATALEGIAATDNTLCATLRWINPTLDNGGQPLESLTEAVIYRDGEEIARITENIHPGEQSEYTDNPLPSPGEHTYRVEVFNENGCSEEPAPETTVFIGPGKGLPYETSDFAEWKVLNINDDWYKWETDYNGVFGFSQTWGDTTDDYALSPFIELEPNHKYQLTVTTAAGGTNEVALVAGQSHDPSKLSAIATVSPDSSEEKQHHYHFTTIPGEQAARSDTGDSETANLPSGKNTFGFHATSTGAIKLTRVQLIDNGTTSGTRTIPASNGTLHYANGIVHCSPGATEIAAYTPAGHLVAKAHNTQSLDLSHLPKGSILIVKASTGENRTTLKIVL